MMNGMPPEPKQTRKVGPIVGALVVVLIIIIVVLFFLGKRLNNPTSTTSNVNVSSQSEANLSSSTEVKDLQADLDVQLKDVDYSF